MDGIFGSTRRRRKPTINITPLIDVMLLLLIFFMVSSTFREQRGLDITLPQAGTAEAQEVSSYVISVDSAGQLYLAGEPVDEAGLRTELERLRAEEPSAVWVLEADAEAHVARFVRAMDIARDVGGERLIIPTDPLDPDAAPNP